MLHEKHLMHLHV